VALLAAALIDEPATTFTEGGLIREGYNAELDRLRNVRDNSRSVLEAYVLEERERTGINTLRVRENRMLGHFLELSRTAAERVPDYFIRRQSLANSERFTTERLSEIESEINDASERIMDLERDLFLEVRATAERQTSPLLRVARALARLDALQSLAHAATLRGYTAPEVTTSTRLEITAGRHPVVEAHLPSGAFVPNDTVLDRDGSPFALITGPNMAGKSTYLRQNALIVLMAQIGSYVPADEAHIGIVDRIFCRVGASDNLARGESTFLVEMNEAAYILRSSTARSLVIMDEIGRGTGTNDGLAIARAIMEHIVGTTRPRTLFATHYHELTALDLPGVKNLSLRIAEEGSEIVFLKRIEEGPSNNSYGLHVARLAGVPRPVLERAQVILEELVEAKEHNAGKIQPVRPAQEPQASLFNPMELIAAELRELDVDSLRPLDALTRLARWQDEIRAAEEEREP
jgi:DNA mismatch repair protein MutS